MNIGIPKERRSYEFRVGLTPAYVQMLVQQGHTCYVEHEAGLGAGFSDQEYEQAGGRIVYSPHEVFGRADMLLKVSRPVYEELEWLRPKTIVAGLLHLTSSRKDKIDLMQEKEITAVSYELIEFADGTVPVRAPLSQIGGTLAAQISGRLLQNNAGGKGILYGGIAGVAPAEAVIIGAGLFGNAAVRALVGMRAHVTVLDTNLEALRRIYDRYSFVTTMASFPHTIARACAYADVVLAAVLVPGQRPPIVVTREIVRSMKPRSVLMDISIDEGGCVETSRPTTHEHSTFVEEGVIHYCVPNIPSVVARTSTYAFLNAAYPFIFEIANKGVDAASADNPAIEKGVALHHGQIRHLPRLTPFPEV